MRRLSEVVAITGRAALSAASSEHGSNYADSRAFFQEMEFREARYPVARLSASAERSIAALREETPRYRHLDRTALMALVTARKALGQAEWSDGLDQTGINIGSSRGATQQLEVTHRQHLDQNSSLSPFTSPVTTGGALSSWLATDLRISGISFSHSVTCSSGLHAMGNGLAWLHSGMAERFLVGGSEAPVTPFTLDQMLALRIHANDAQTSFPCQPLASSRQKGTGMVLGEGAAVVALEKRSISDLEKVHAVVAGFGSGHEPVDSPTSISQDGFALQQAMRQALARMQDDAPVDAVLVHAPGTARGDEAELNALRQTFGDQMPMVLSNKWQIGHLLGASGALSIDHALDLIRDSKFAAFPYDAKVKNEAQTIRKIMINSAGFGGNACSVILSRPELYQ